MKRDMPELTLDHAGVAVTDLERGRAVFDRLGFRLTARSLHAGSPAPGAPVVPWGSGNHCAMLAAGYLEVVGLTDPARYSSVKSMVARYEGLHIVAFGCGDADATYRALAARGLPVDAPRALERDAAFGTRDEALRRARFRNVYLDPQRYPEARFLYIEHLTRDALWQPHLVEQPNGVVALDQIYFCTNDAAATGARIGAVTGVNPVAATADHVELRLARGTLHVLAAAAWTTRSGVGRTPCRPSPIGLGFRVRSLARTHDLLAQRGVPMSVRDGIWVGPDHACGATLRFFEEN